MKPILKEIISEFYLLHEMARTKGATDSKPRALRQTRTKGDGIVPAGLYGVSGGKYYRDSQHNQYVGRVTGAGADRKWLPAAVEPAQLTRGRGRPRKIPDAPQPTTARPTTSTPKKIDISVAIQSMASSKKESVLKLVRALKDLQSNSTNTRAIKDTIEKLGIAISSTGRLTFTKIPERHPFSSKPKSREVAYALVRALAPYKIKLAGVENIRHASIKTPESGYKPTTLFKSYGEANVKPITYETSGDVRGFSVGKNDYTVYTRNKKQLVEVILDEIFLGKGLSKANATRQAAYVDDVLACHNQKIKFIGNALSGTTPIKFTEVPPGKQGAKQISDTLVSAMIASKKLPEKQAVLLRNITNDLTKANNITEFDSQWGGLRRVLEENKAGLGPGAIPEICEIVAVIRKCIDNQRILVPLSPTFRTADLIAIGTPLKQIDVDNLEEVVDNIELISVLVDLESVKFGPGAASSIREKLALTQFDSATVPQDLTILIGGKSHAELWTDSEEEFKAYNTRTIEVLTRNLKTIIEYYRLPPNSTIKTVMAILAGGSVPRYDAKGKYLGPGSPDSAFGKKMDDMNRRQLRMFSIVGLASDAIYNTRVNRQAFTNTTFKPDQIIDTDGYNVMGRSLFQFNKDIMPRPTQKKSVFRGQGFYSKIIPTTREQMRTTK